MSIRSIRGAVQLSEDIPEAVKNSVKKLMDEIFSVNNLAQEQIISVFFSQTRDIRSYNPAKAAREAGYHCLNYFCLQELEVENSMKRVIRVLIHLETAEQNSLTGVYLDGAEKLRPDLYMY